MFAKRNESAGGRSAFFILRIVTIQYKLPRPVLPGCPRPARPCRTLALCSLGPFPWTLRLELTILALLYRACFARWTFLSALLKRWLVRITSSLHLGKPACLFQWFLRFTTCSLGGDADLHEANIKPIEGKGLVPPSTLSRTPSE